MAGLKRRIADAVSDAGSKLAKPADSEAAGIKATEDAENEYLNAVKATMPSSESSSESSTRPEGTSADHVNPLGKYGDRGSEERIDTSSYRKPLSGTPVYDRGGVVGKQPREVIQDPQMEINRIYEQQDHRMRPMSHSDEPVQRAEVSPIVQQPKAPAVYQGMTPVYDQGGLIGDDPLTMAQEDKPEPFNMTDGKHQAAIVENGERVLTPEENAQYEKEHPQTVSPTADAAQSAKMKPMVAPHEAPMVGPAGPGQAEPAEKIDQEAQGAKLRPIAGAAEEVMPTPKGADVMESGKVAPEAAGAIPTPGTPVHPFGPQMTGIDEYHSHLRDLKNEMETGFQNKDYVKAGNAKLALNELEKANPRGSEYNHPGLLGKIEHGLSIAGQAAANTVVGPGLMASIPGTQAHMNLEAQQGEQLAGEGVKRGLETEQTAVAHKAANAPDPIDQQLAQAQADQQAHPTPEGEAKVKGLQDILDKGKVPPVDKLNQQLFDAEQKRDASAPGSPERAAAEQAITNLKDSINQGKTQPAGTAEANLEKTQAIFKQMEQKGYDVTDPKHQAASIKTALAKGDINADMASEAQSYLGTHGAAPATSVTVAGEKTAQSQAIKDAAKTYAYTDENGVRHWAKGNQVPAGTEAEEVKDLTVQMANARAGNVIQDSLNKLRKDIDDAPVIFDDAAARSVLATATDSGKAAKLGLYVPGLGGIGITAPAGSSKAIDALLENNAIHGDEAKALKNYISDYIYAKEQAGKMLIEGQGGKMGRMNSLAYSALIDQIPGGGTPDSTEARHRMDNLQAQHSEFANNIPDKYDNFVKTKPYEGSGAKPAGANAAQPANASYVYHQDNDPKKPVVGYAVDGKYVDAAGYKAGKPVTQP
jgi:hypothetical protein